MTGLGVQMLLSLVGIRSAFLQYEIMEIVEIVRAFGSAYRLASSGAGLNGAAYGRLAFDFSRGAVASVQSRLWGIEHWFFPV